MYPKTILWCNTKETKLLSKVFEISVIAHSIISQRVKKYTYEFSGTEKGEYWIKIESADKVMCNIIIFGGKFFWCCNRHIKFGTFLWLKKPKALPISELLLEIDNSFFKRRAGFQTQLQISSADWFNVSRIFVVCRKTTEKKKI